VFGDVTADTPEEVAANWEEQKLSEKNRSSVTEGIPVALPALALAAKLQRKALAVGMVLPDVDAEAGRVAEAMSRLSAEVRAVNGWDGGQAPVRITDGEGGRADQAQTLGEVLFSLANVARSLGVDPETALRARAARFRASVEQRG
jgi:uncharacterized protein YabN with tetrapyrrole methylase and pyrophosphatase domain